MADPGTDEDFPHTLTIHIPFPTHRLANAALRSLAVDEELSPLVKRHFSLVSSSDIEESSPSVRTSDLSLDGTENTILHVHYKASTPRMLRVAVNGFFESLGVIVQVMAELDVDVLHEKGIETLEGAQGIVEIGMTGTGVGVAK